MYPVVFLGDSLEVLRNLPEPIRRSIGFQIHLIQLGHKPNDIKPLRNVGQGVFEIRVTIGRLAYRVIYTIKVLNAIFILHIFNKKSRTTPLKDIKLSRTRFLELLNNIDDGSNYSK